jgi:hypothetical protein
MRDEDKTREQLIAELVALRRELAEVRGQRPKAEGVVAKEAPHGTEEPWLPVETKLVGISVASGIVALVVLAILVHMFLLGGH